MKKIIVFGLLLFVAFFSNNSKKQPKRQRNVNHKYNVNERQQLIQTNNHSLYKFDEPIKNSMILLNKEIPMKHFSRHRKGKIIYKKNNPINHTIVF